MNVTCLDNPKSRKSKVYLCNRWDLTVSSDKELRLKIQPANDVIFGLPHIMLAQF